jgi:hypothetical protein
LYPCTYASSYEFVDLGVFAPSIEPLARLSES